jgi:Putative transposase/Transposase zinc-binding domain
MARPAPELAALFRRHGAAYRKAHKLSLEQLRVMRAVEICRTAALGGHKDQCGQCGHMRISYNSCRNRHCPKCQNGARAKWLADRKAELLPVEYFHVVFTVPQLVAEIALHNPETVYDILFQTASQTLLTIARDRKHLGAEIGFFAVLHTWGQNLLHHPHLHCVVPGGGVSSGGDRWIECKPGFFLPVRVLSRLFRKLFLERLEHARAKGGLRWFGQFEGMKDEFAWRRSIQSLTESEWVVYAKPPFGGPQRVIEYLGRYTHRVAISNQRIVSIANGQVTFRWKDYRHRNHHKSRIMTIDSDEFIRRFLMHVLPPGFQRIRHFGFSANCHRQRRLPLVLSLLSSPVVDLLPNRLRCRQMLTELPPALSPWLCCQCGSTSMRPIEILPTYRWPARPPDSS